MILTCPNCSSHFNIDSAMLGEKGRKVKCTTCEEKWFQEPPEEDHAAETVAVAIEVDLKDADAPHEDIEPEPIDEAVEEPQPEIVKKALEAAAEKKVEKVKVTKEVKLGIAASILLFVMILTYLLMSSTSIMSKNPSAQAFYALFGIQMDVPGVGLVFDRVAAQENGTVIKISGNITNLENTDKKVPLIEASIMDAEGAVVEQWMIMPHETIMMAEHTQHFTDEHPIPHGVHLDHTSVSVRFVLSAADAVVVGMEDDGHGAEHKNADKSGDHDISHEAETHDEDSHEPEHHDTGHDEPSAHH